jgi:hypothetical protein
MMEKYRLAMKILHKQSEYTDDDLNRFQDLIDYFFKNYVRETGVQGITNYLHMLGSGHIKIIWRYTAICTNSYNRGGSH